jgi:hypothetical protein
MDQSDDITIRPARQADLEQLSEFYLQSFAVLGMSITPAMYRACQDGFINHMIPRMENPDDFDAYVALAVNKDDIVTGYIEYSILDEAKLIQIEWMQAKEPRHGIGTGLIDYVIQEGRRRKLEKIYVDAIDNAFAFYQKAGFIRFDPESTLTQIVAMELSLVNN